MKFKCYDTCSLLLQAEQLFEEEKEEYKIVISSIVLEELENIKTSFNKDIETKISARKVLQKLNQNPDKIELVLYKEIMSVIFHDAYTLTNDLKIISCIYSFLNTHPEDEVIFITNDLLCKHFAKLYLPTVEEIV